MKENRVNCWKTLRDGGTTTWTERSGVMVKKDTILGDQHPSLPNKNLCRWEGSETRACGLFTNNSPTKTRLFHFFVCCMNVIGNHCKFFICKKVGVKRSMMCWAEGNKIPRGGWSIITDRNDVGPLCASGFSADDTKRRFVFFTPRFNVSSAFIPIFFAPFGFCFFYRRWVRGVPALFIPKDLSSMFFRIIFLPNVVFRSIIARSAKAERLMGYIGSTAIIALIKIMFIRPHSDSLKDYMYVVNEKMKVMI